MKPEVLFRLEPHPAPPSGLGHALGIGILTLSVLAIAIPFLGTAYLNRLPRGGDAAAVARTPHSPLPPATLAPPAPANAAGAAPAMPPTGRSIQGPPPHAARAPSPDEARHQFAAAPAAVAVPASLELTSTAGAAGDPTGKSAPVDPPRTPPAGASAADPVIDIAFPHGSARLPNDRHALSEIAALYRRHGGTVQIIGYGEPGDHRDPTAQTSFGLAIDRAKAVAVALSQLGVSPGDLRVEAAPQHSVAASGATVGVGAEIFIIRS